MLEARNITVVAGSNTLLREVAIAVPAGRVVVLIGPNGAGKSTLLKVLSGEMRPSGGEALLDGRPLRAYTAAELSRRRAVVPQSSLLGFPFTVLEVAMLGITVPGFGADTTAAEQVAGEALETVGLSAIADRLYVHLSGGERQRVHIARALAQMAVGMPSERGRTRCLLLDEPTSSLDLAHQGLVLRAARRQAELGFAVLAVMHDLNLAAALADELVLLVGGAVTAVGAAERVLQDRLLTQAYGCPVHASRTPPERPFVLPPAMFAAPHTATDDRGKKAPAPMHAPVTLD